MATFDMISCKIVMNSGNLQATRAEMEQIPANVPVTISFSHEYIHFLQLISSFHGLRLLAELLRIGLHGAAVLGNLVDSETGGISGYHNIGQILEQCADHAGKQHTDLVNNWQILRDEATVLLTPWEYPYSGTELPWSIIYQYINYGTYTNKMYGIVTCRATFRPLTPGLLSEGMARRIDRWIATNLGDQSSWPASDTEKEYYNGILNVLKQPAYAHNVTPTTCERITVVISNLALMTPTPDYSISVMLGRLKQTKTAGGLVETIAEEMKQVLQTEGLLNLNAYNDVLTYISNITRIMDRQEYLLIYNHLQRIKKVADQSYHNPGFFADTSIEWPILKNWMIDYSIPPVLALDGEVALIDGVPTTHTVSDLLDQIKRVLWLN